jgi:hypothetical protein
LFNVSTGLVESSSNCVASIASAGVNANGNTYYRCTVTMNADTDGAGSLELGLHNGTSNNYTGTAGLGVYIFGAQFSETADSSTYLSNNKHQLKCQVLMGFLHFSLTIKEVQNI